MSRIVTSTYRYKRPPKRKGRKLAEITGPAVVTAKGSRRPVGVGETAAESEESARSERTGDTKPSTPSGKVPAPANDDRKYAIVTALSPETKDLVDRMMLGRWPGSAPPKKSQRGVT